MTYVIKFRPMNNTRQLSNIVLLEFLKKFSGDIYIIALPAIAASFNTDRQHVQIMISFFLLGVAASQLITGALSDHVGRRPVLLYSLMVFTLGSFVCAAGFEVWFLLTGIAIMGFGIGSAPTIGKAMIHDLYKKSGKTAMFLVITSSFVVWAPAIAMAVGGNFAHYFGWESIFLLSDVLGILALAFSYFFLRETTNQRPSLCFCLNHVVICLFSHNQYLRYYSTDDGIYV
jgi:DHA1 family bicyclomycin/chloramphenicol resistance-like MFS transporter